MENLIWQGILYLFRFAFITYMENIAANISQVKTVSLKEKAAAYIELSKPRIAFMLVLTAAAGFYLGVKDSFQITLFINSMLGIAFLAFGVSTLNQFIERRTDLLMERTSRRPLPVAKVSPFEALVFGITLCLLAEVYLAVFVNFLTAALGLVVIIGYVFLYTPLKRKTSASTAIGAIPGAMPPLMGWTSAANEISLGAWILFAMLFLWQFPHFWRSLGYTAINIKSGHFDASRCRTFRKMTARQIVIFTIMLVPISLAPFS